MADFMSELLAHVFNNANIPDLGDAVGLRGSATVGSLFVSLHTGDPGETGTQATNETSYIGYGRVQLARTTGSFTVSGRTVSFTSNIEFPTCTGGSPVITHFGIGVAATGAGKLLYSGPLTPQMPLASGRIPILTAATAISEGGPAQTVVGGLGLSAALAACNAAGQAISGGATGMRFYPRATTTGPSSAAIAAGLTVRTSQWNATAGQLIEGVDLRNRLIVNAGANNVTVRDCIISAGGASVVQIAKGVTGFKMERCLVDGQYATTNLIGGNGTFIDCDFRRAENGYNAEGWIPVVIDGCYVHDFIKSSSWAGHRDGIQIFGEGGGTGYMTATITRTTVHMDGSPVGNASLYTANTFGPCRDVLWRNCWAWSQGGGYTCSFQDGNTTSRMINISWRDNYIISGYAGNNADGYLYRSNPGRSGDDPDFWNNTNVLVPQAQRASIEAAPWIVNGVRMAQDTPPPH